MTALAKVGTYRLSAGYSRTVAGHKKALGAPMIGAAMIADPLIRAAELPTAAAALRERRACQYAAAMARKSGALPSDQSAFHALWDEATTRVHFVTTGANQRVYASYTIPAHVLEFDADREILCLPAPDPEPEAPCELTAAMVFDTPSELPENPAIVPQEPETPRQPAPIAAAAIAPPKVAKPARKARRKSRKPRKRTGMKTITFMCGRGRMATVECRI